MNRAHHCFRPGQCLAAGLAALLSVALATGGASAQPPVGFRPRTQAIRGARLVVRPGTVIEHGNLVIRDGRIIAVGPQATIPVEAEIIDGTSLTAYAGLIDAATDELIDNRRLPAPADSAPVEFSRFAIAATQPDNRRGLSPEFEASTALLPDGGPAQVRRENGITTLHVLPTAPIAPGAGCLLTLAGRPPREALVAASTLAVLRLEPPPQKRGAATDSYPSTVMGAVAHLRQAFLDAEHHATQQRLYAANVTGVEPPPHDPSLDALSALRAGPRRAVFYAQSRDEILRALNFAAEQELVPVILGGREAAQCLEQLKSAAADVILMLDFGDEPKPEASPTSGKLTADVKSPLRWQQDQRERWQQHVATAARLHEAGLRFAFGSQGLKKPEDFLKQVRLAIAAGLPADAAVGALTSQAAEILGAARELGTLDPGRRGCVVLLNGPLESTDSKVRFVLADGLKFEFNKPHESDQPPAALSGDPTAVPNLSGTWALTIDAGEMRTTDATLELVQTDRTLRGTFRSEHGEGRLSDGHVTGNSCRFVVAIGAGGTAVELQFEGTFAVPQEGPKTQAAAIPAEVAQAATADVPQTADVTQTDDMPEPEPVPESSERTPSPTADAHAPSVTEMSGTVKSAFGAPAKWTGRRNPQSQENAAGPVQLSIEIDNQEPPATGTVPKSAGGGPIQEATQPAASDAPLQGGQASAPQVPPSSRESQPTTAAAAGELPTELDADRRHRPQPTGGNVLVRGGIILTGSGQTLVDASIMIRGGVIVAIGNDLSPDAGMSVIDARGRYIIPGIIDTHSHIMISGGVNEGTLSIVPEVRIRDVVRTDDPAEYRALSGGVTTARLLHGSADVIGGQDAVVKLKFGATAGEHIVPDAPQGVKFALGENVKDGTDRFPHSRMGVEATLKRAFYEALDYRRQWQAYHRACRNAGMKAHQLLPPRRDLRLEALAGILDHEMFIHCHCYRADEILMLLRTARELGIHVQSLQHVLEGYKIAPEIAAHGASCSTFSDWWAYKVEAYDATPFNAALLNEAGVNIVVKSDNPELMRHLNLEAAKSLRYGNMPVDDALQMVTLHPARELGLEERIGSLDVGKDGDLAIFNGHPFNALARCELTLIDGEVFFQRAAQPTAMSAAEQERTAHPPELVLAPPEVRNRPLELPAAANGCYAVIGANVYPVDRDMIENGVVIVRDGRITAVGPFNEIEVPHDATVIRAGGLQVYPGLIDAGCRLGITEIGKVTETHDYADSGRLQPDLRAGIAINVDSELIPVARAGGITTALIHPGGGIISGQCSLMQTAGWTTEEMALDYEAGLALHWPDDDKSLDELRDFLDQARLYDAIRSASKHKQPDVIIDPRFEAMRPYLQGKKPVFVEAHSRKHIAQALLFAETQKLRIILTGATDAWKLADEIRQRDVAVIAGPTMREPVEPFDPFDAPYANPGRLYDAGVLMCIRSDHASNSRNAPFEAAQAVAYGLPANEGLKAVTVNAAKVLGIADQVGSITAGKRANLVICDGSPLQPTTQIKGIFVGGRPFLPESRQTRLYEHYRERLHAAGAITN